MAFNYDEDQYENEKNRKSTKLNLLYISDNVTGNVLVFLSPKETSIHEIPAINPRENEGEPELDFKPLLSKAKSEAEKHIQIRKPKIIFHENFEQTESIFTGGAKFCHEDFIPSIEELKSKDPPENIREYTETIILFPYYHLNPQFKNIFNKSENDKKTKVYKVTLINGVELILKTVTWENLKPEKSKKRIAGFIKEFNICHTICHFSEKVVKVLDMKHVEINRSNEIQIAFLFEYGGDSLDKLAINRIQKMTNEEIYRIICQLACIYEIMEFAGIAHMDIKPSNITYNTELKQIKIIDFGTAVSFAKSPEKLKQELGLLYLEKFCGLTLLYAPPEAINARENLAERQKLIPQKIDVFCFGITIAQILLAKFGINLLTKRNDSGLREIFARDASTESHNEFRKKISATLHWLGCEKFIRLILKCIEYDPMKRPTFNEIKNMLLIIMIRSRSESFLELDEVKSWTHIRNIAYDLIVQNDYESLALICERAIASKTIQEKSKDETAVKVILGLAYCYISGKADKAINIFTTELEKMDDKNSDSYLLWKIHLASAYQNLNETTQAIQVYEQIERIIKENKNPNLIILSQVYNQFALCYYYSYKFEISIEYCQKALDIFFNNNLIITRLTIIEIINLGRSYFAMKKYVEADEQYTKAEQLLSKMDKKYNDTFINIYTSRADLYLQTRNYLQSKKYLSILIEACSKFHGEENYTIAEAYAKIACISYIENNSSETLSENLQKSVKILDRILGSECIAFNFGFELLITMLLKQKKYEDAITSVIDAMIFHEKEIFSDKCDIRIICQHFGDILENSYTFDEAISYYMNVIDILKQNNQDYYYDIANIYIMLAYKYTCNNEWSRSKDSLLEILKIMKNSNCLKQEQLSYLMGRCLYRVKNYLRNDKREVARNVLEKIKHENIIGFCIKKHYELEDLGWCYERLGESQQAIKFYSDCLNYMEKEGLNQDKFIITVLQDLIRVYQHEENYEMSVLCGEKAFEKQKKIIPEKLQEIADTCIDLGNDYKMLCNYSDSAKYFKEAYQLIKKIYGKEHYNTLNRYCDYAFADKNLENYDKALTKFMKVLRIIEKNPLNIETKVIINLRIKIYEDLAGIFDDLHCYKKSIEYFQNAIKLYPNVNSKCELKIALGYENIAKVLRNAKLYGQAIVYHFKSIDIVKKIQGFALSAKLGRRYNSLGITYALMNNFPKSKEYYNKALEVFQNGSDIENYDIANAIKNLGIAYLRSKDPSKKEEARSLIYHALETYEALPDKFSLMNAYLSISNGFRFIKSYEEAICFKLQAYEVIKGIVSPNNIDLATLYRLLGIEYNFLNNSSEAIEFLHKALSVYTQIFRHKKNPWKIPDNLNIACVFYELGIANHHLKQYKNAIDYYNISLDMYNRLYGDFMIIESYLDLYQNLGNVYFEIGDYENSIQMLDKYDRLFELCEVKDKEKYAKSFKTLLNAYRKLVMIEWLTAKKS